MCQQAIEELVSHGVDLEELVKVLQSRLVQTNVSGVTDFSKGTCRSLRRATNDTEAAARICRNCVDLGGTSFRCNSSVCTSRRAVMRL